VLGFDIVAPRKATLATGKRLENVTEDHGRTGTLQDDRAVAKNSARRDNRAGGRLLPKGNVAMRTHILLAGSVLLLALSAVAQDAKSAFCNFDDDNQVSIQYSSVVKDPPRNGKVWSPGVTLYVQTPLTLGNSTLGLGAYSVHFIPEKKSWTLIVNKNVTAGHS
jgi:hypothetical protein